MIVPEIPVAPGEEHWLLDTSLDEVYWPCSHSRAIPSFPSQLEWKIGLAWVCAVICDRLHPDGTTFRHSRERYLQFYDAKDIMDVDVRPNDATHTVDW